MMIIHETKEEKATKKMNRESFALHIKRIIFFLLPLIKLKTIENSGFKVNVFVLVFTKFLSSTLFFIFGLSSIPHQIISNSNNNYSNLLKSFT